MRKLKLKSMMKAFSFLLLFSATFVNAQTFEWATGFGSQYDDIATSTVVDASGNVYVVGTFRETVDFDPSTGTMELQSNGGIDVFIQKLDPNGNLLWAKNIGGAQNDKAGDICLDADNNVYVIGAFKKTADFDPGDGTEMRTSKGSSDAFIEKLNSDGEFIWVRTLGSSSIEEGAGIATDPNGNVYVTGIFRKVQDFDFGAGTFTMTPVGAKDIFIQKISATGDFQWAAQIGSSSDESAVGITTDAMGNVYTIGNFKGSVDFDPGTDVVTRTSRGQSDIFIQKLDTNGEFVWINTVEGTSNNEGRAVQVDNNSNVFCAGIFSGVVDFDPDMDLSHDIVATGQVDGFIQKIDNEGKFVWAKKLGTPDDDGINDLFIDGNNDFYVTGYFTGNFEITTGTTLNAVGSKDVFIAKYSNDGVVKMATSFGGALVDEGKNIFVDVNANIYTVGYYNLVVDFDPTIQLAQATNSGLKDAFVQKLNYCVAAETPALSSSSIEVCEGEEVNLNILSGELNGATKWAWFEGSCVTGFVGEGTTVTLIPSESTTYFVSAIGGCISNPVCHEIAITVNSAAIEEVTAETCMGAEYVFEDGTTMTINEVTTHSSVFETTSECDSTIITTVSPIIINANVETSDNTITATQQDATYQWLNCETQEIIQGETNASFTPTTTGSFAVVITKNDCNRTSDCVNINLISANSPVWKKDVSIQPNPMSTQLAINFGEAINGTVSLMHITGRTLYSEKLNGAHELAIDVASMPSGVYFVQVLRDGAFATFRVVK